MKISPVTIIRPKLEEKYYEKGPNGELGVWTRNGGNYAFFTPLSQIEKAEETAKQKPAKQAPKQEETPEEYTKRKINSREWMG